MLLDTPTPDANRRLTVTAITFWTDYEPDPNDPTQMRAVEWVKWGKRGDFGSSANVDKVNRVRLPLRQTRDDGSPEPNPVWLAIEAQYDAWKKGLEVPVGGTPLEAWSALTKSQAQAFKGAGFSCIEHIAAMEDSHMQKVRLPDTRRLRDLARAYVAHRDQSAPIEAKMAAQQSELDAMRAELAEATEALKRLASEDAEPAKRGPGRPRKPENVAEAFG
jgi:hypothetical protein